VLSQVLYNAAAVYCMMGQWEQAAEVLLSTSQERGAGRNSIIEPALESVSVSLETHRLRVSMYLYILYILYIHMHANT